MKILIDDEFRKRIPPLTPESRGHLEANIEQHGCIDPLIVWDSGEGHVLLDGHNRYAICRELGVEFTVHVMDTEEIASREAAEDWIDRHSLGRRHLSPADFKIISGRIYNRRKRQGERTDLTFPQIDEKSTTAEQVAKELGTSKATIERNAVRAELHDALLEAGETEAAEAAKEAPQSDIVDARKRPLPEAAEQLKAKRHHVTQASGEFEWYTPPEFIEAARKVMGGIDLDPCTSSVAQKKVKAKRHYTAEHNGLAKKWSGRVWMNPPYSKTLLPQFIEKITAEWEAGNIDEAIVLLNNATDTAWFHALSAHASAMCFPRGRIRFLDAKGVPANAPTQGQVFVRLCDRDDDSFCGVFADIGICVKVL